MTMKIEKDRSNDEGRGSAITMTTKTTMGTTVTTTRTMSEATLWDSNDDDDDGYDGVASPEGNDRSEN